MPGQFELLILAAIICIPLLIAAVVFVIVLSNRNNQDRRDR